VATVITFYFKISIHALAAAGLSGMILGMMIIARDARLAVPLAVSMLLCGAVMSARLQLNAHRPIETTYGAVVGFALGVAGMLLLF
ncbi:MAG: PA-phosphatase, partial [Cyclobacteriaceae bacterium]|nr:PA-phosphatase [Cyclobacteriaceae bacterium]